MKRVGRIVKLKPQMKERYIRLHADPWPEVTEAIHICGIRNFSIYVKGEILFSYFEYVGNAYEDDMKKLDELTAEWLKETDKCQEPVDPAETDGLWSTMDEIFYQE